MGAWVQLQARVLLRQNLARTATCAPPTHAAQTARAQFGMLGLGDTEDRNAPTVVRALLGKPVKLLACGWRHAIAGTADGHVYTWGAWAWSRRQLGGAAWLRL